MTESEKRKDYALQVILEMAKDLKKSYYDGHGYDFDFIWNFEKHMPDIINLAEDALSEPKPSH